METIKIVYGRLSDLEKITKFTGNCLPPRNDRIRHDFMNIISAAMLEREEVT